MKTTKSISYAFPTSSNAKKLGFDKEGCWHISQTHYDIEGSGQCKTFMPHDAEGFESPNHPDLIALFHEYEGEPDRSFVEYGNEKALKSLNLAS